MRSPEDLPETFGRYRIFKKLGQGGMGAVYLAHDTQLERQVALKVPRFSANERQDVVERFLREARAAATIQHPNLCPVFDVGQIDGKYYMTMAYIEGHLLSAYIRPGKPVPELQVAGVVRKLAMALQEAHAHGVVHRDLKPTNIIINHRNDPVIMDFGLARRAQRQDVALTQDGTMLGTPAYMAPEQARGESESIGPRSDVYSLGVIMYELLTGSRPFQGEMLQVLSQILTVEPDAPSKRRPNLDPRMEVICLKAMAKRMEVRHATMAELAAALTEYMTLAKGSTARIRAEVAVAAAPPIPPNAANSGHTSGAEAVDAEVVEAEVVFVSPSDPGVAAPPVPSSGSTVRPPPRKPRAPQSSISTTSAQAPGSDTVKTDLVPSRPAPKPPAARKPSVSAGHSWYYLKGGFMEDEITGPLTDEAFLHEVREGRIGLKVKVMSPTFTKKAWCPLQKVPNCLEVWEEGEAERAEAVRSAKEAKVQEKIERKRQEAEAKEQCRQLELKQRQEDEQRRSAAMTWSVVPENDEVTVGQLLDLLSRLPDRLVTRVFPGGGQDKYPLSVFRRDVSGKDPSAVIYTPDTMFVLKKAVAQNGNLFLEYGCAFAHFGQKILKRESEVANDADARSVVQALREIGVRTEMGIACHDYSQLVASVALRVRDFVQLEAARYPLFAALVNGIFSNYRDVVSMWQQGAGSAPMQFTGGGFGLQGAVTGMAVAAGLNALFGASHQKKQTALNDRISAEWGIASKKLRVAEIIMRQGNPP